MKCHLVCLDMYASVCVCMRERERERESIECNTECVFNEIKT